MKIHQIRIDFNVTEQIKRFVYVYVIEAENCYLVDSGVYGSQDIIIDYLKSIGRDISSIKGILLTHAHPDHIGNAAYFQEKIGCKVYASAGEQKWIEDIGLQFKERPIPNFYNLAGKSTKVDVIVKQGDEINLEDNLKVMVISAAGHSADEVSYLVENAIFIGDSVPVKGDIPIYVNLEDTIKSLDILENIKGIEVFYPAWDKAYTSEEMKQKIDDARNLIDIIDESVAKTDGNLELVEVVDYVCSDLNMPMLKQNPLFARTVLSHRIK